MKREIFIIGVSILAGIIVMLVHEISKTMVYFIYKKIYEPEEDVKGIWKFWRYIDGIGIIMALTRNGIFSRGYPFLIKSKKAAVTIGVTGYLSMIATFCASCFLYKNNCGNVTEYSTYMQMFMPYLLEFCAYFSVAMFLVNCFPMLSLDMSLIIAGKSQKALCKMSVRDPILKLLLMVLLICDVYSDISRIIVTYVLFT